MKPTILFLEPIDPEALALLPLDQYTVVLPGVTNPDYSGVRAIITRGKEQVDRPLIDQCPQLEVVVRCGVGVNNIAVAYATNRHIAVFNVPGINAATVVEHTLGLMLMLVRGMYRLVQEVKAGNWAYRDAYQGKELRDLRLGILGSGNIGQRVGGAAGAMGMKVRYAQRSPQEAPTGDRLPLHELLAGSDVLSLHLPLTDETSGIIDAAAIARMPAGSFLINTARGELVDPKALLSALESGHIAGYASDLGVGDATIGQQLLAHPAVLITPHAASLTALTFREMSKRSVQHVVDHFRGQAVADCYRVN